MIWEDREHRRQLLEHLIHFIDVAIDHDIAKNYREETSEDPTDIEEYQNELLRHFGELIDKLSE